MQLGAAHHDAVGAALDDAHIQIGVVLLVGATLAVALGVGDHLGSAQVVVAAVVVHALDVGGVLRVDLGDVVFHAHQSHVDAGDQCADGGVLHQLDANREVLFAARDLVDAVRLLTVFGLVAPQLAVFGLVVDIVFCDDLDRQLESRMGGDVVDAFAVPERHASVAKAFAVLRGGFECHLCSWLNAVVAPSAPQMSRLDRPSQKGARSAGLLILLAPDSGSEACQMSKERGHL